MFFKVIVFVCICSSVISWSSAGDSIKVEDKPDWAKKDIRDYSDADMERLFDQWEENEDELPPNERPEHLRPQPQVDFNNLNMNDPEGMMKLTKKNKPVMLFVKVRDDLPEPEVQTLTALWQQSMQNNHLVCDRYVIEPHRVIYMFKDGSLAWDAKDYLISVEQVEEVTIDNQVFPGKHSKKAKEEL